MNDPAQLAKKEIARVAMDQRDVVMIAEQAHHLIPLAGAHQAGIDEDAGELLADRLAQQRRDHRGIDAAGEAADDPAPADLLAYPRDRLGTEGGHRPIAAAAGDAMGEAPQQRRAMRRVHHLGVELHAIEAPAIVGDGGERRTLAHADDAEARRQGLDAVAMAHPHLLARALLPHPFEERAAVDDVEEGAPELAMVGGQDAAAQLRAHQLLAIADAEHRHAHLEHLLGRERRRLFVHRGRTARQDDALRRERGELFLAHVEGMDLAIDAALAQPPRDELGHLAAEIEDEDAVCHGMGRRKWRIIGGDIGKRKAGSRRLLRRRLARQRRDEESVGAVARRGEA